MRYLTLIVMLIMVIISSCRENNHTSNVIQGKGLSEVGVGFNDMILMDDKRAYLFGDKMGEVTWNSDRTANSINTALIFETQDRGQSWDTIILGEGRILKANCFNGELYATKWNDNLNESIIYKLNQKDSKWNEYDQLNVFVRDLLLFKDGYGLIAASDSTEEFNLYETKDNGVNWSILQRLHRISQPLFKEDKVLYLSHVGDDSIVNYNVLVHYDLVKKTSIIEELPVGFKAYLMVEYKNQLYFAGIVNDDVIIYKRTGRSQFKSIYKLNLGTRIFPQRLHVFGREILLLVGERESLYIKNHLFRSFDAGETWVEENLKNDLNAKPVAFHNDTTNQSFDTWIYSGSGQIQILGGK